MSVLCDVCEEDKGWWWKRGGVRGGDGDGGSLWQVGTPGTLTREGADMWSFVEGTLGSALCGEGEQPGQGASSGHAALASPLGVRELEWPSELSPAGPRWQGLPAPASMGH